MADDTGVGIRLLGGFEATVGGRLVAAGAWRLRKAKTLVKLLVLADGHRMYRESLVALLWPDRDTASGINNLHQALYVARRVLAPGSGVLFPLREDVVLLSDSAMPWLDVEAFEAACRRARETRAPGDYRSADKLYRGDLLPEDQFEAWAEAPRDALRERRLGLLLEYAEVLSERREYTEVVEIVGAVTAADPFHEGAYRLLMTALAARGRRYEALAAFDRLRESLTREFAADPEPATRRLYRALLTGGGQSPDSAMAAEPATAISTALARSRTVATTAMTTGPVVAVRPDAAGTPRMAPARGLGTLGEPLADLMGPMPYTAMQSLLDPLWTAGAQNYFTGALLSGLTDETIDTLLARHASGRAPVRELHLHHCGGAMARVAAAATAFAHRNAAYVLNIIARSPDRDGFPEHIGWARATHQAVNPWTTGGAYVNFTSESGADKVQASYPPDTYARLVAVKDRYDPTNLFQLNQNIRPSGRN